MLVVAIHGFWGRPGDFEETFSALKALLPSIELELWAPELFCEDSRLSPKHHFSQWSQNFEEELSIRGKNRDLLCLGYSLGGRLLLHGLAQICKSGKDWPWRGAYFLSSNPGVIAEDEILGRRRWEADWSQRFRVEPWENLQRDWNALAVFNSSRKPRREEVDYSRDFLARALETWSVTRHESSLEDLKSLPQHWCFGSKDAKYSALGKRLERDYDRSVAYFEDAGHRLLWDAPTKLAQFIARTMV